MTRLEGRTALVTGAGRNIGRAIALKLAGEGANVVVNARSNREEAEAVAEEVRSLGVDAMAALADVADHEQVSRMFAAAAERFGQVDVLVSNAAIRPAQALHRVDAGRLGAGARRGAGRGVLLRPQRPAGDAGQRLRAHCVPDRRRGLERLGGALPRVGGQDGHRGTGAGAGLGVRAPQRAGSTWSRRDA